MCMYVGDRGTYIDTFLDPPLVCNQDLKMREEGAAEERSVALSVQHYLVLSSDIRTAGMIAETDKLSHPSCLQDSYTATITCNE